jgi:hypothetical protein
MRAEPLLPVATVALKGASNKKPVGPPITSGVSTTVVRAVRADEKASPEAAAPGDEMAVATIEIVANANKEMTFTFNDGTAMVIVQYYVFPRLFLTQ